MRELMTIEQVNTKTCHVGWRVDDVFIKDTVNRRAKYWSD